MKYRVTHTTEYGYDEIVPLGHNVLRLQPRDHDRQRRIASDLSINPMPASRRERIDFFGNHALWISVQEPHSRLEIVARSEVEVSPRGEYPEPIFHLSWQDVPAMLAGNANPELQFARQFTFESTYVPINEELAEYARPSFPLGKPLLPCVVDITRRIQAEFAFIPGVTTVGTPVLEVLHQRKGVCQDFAHLQIACLRSLGLAARYVSGYIVTRPPPGQPRLRGADMSHAWVSVVIPDIGWVDCDPTNGSLPSDEHITLGWARDYEDIVPVRGVITSSHHHTLQVAVDVEPVKAP